MNERLKQEIEQQWNECDSRYADRHYLVAELSERDYTELAEHFYNLALADVRKEIEERRDFMYKRYISKGIGCIEEYRYDQCVELLDFIDNLTK